MARRSSALAALERLTADFEKQRQAIMQRAKKEAAPAVVKIVDQLERYAKDFPDIVRNAISRFMDDGTGTTPTAKGRGRPKGSKNGTAATKPKAKPSKATPAQMKKVIGYLLTREKAGATAIAEATKVPTGIVSAVLKELRSKDKAKSIGKGRATVWTMTGK